MNGTFSIAPLRAFYEGAVTRSLTVRLRYLESLEKQIRKKEKDILAALRKDLGKSEFEGYATEIGLVLEEIRYFRKNLRALAKPKSVFPSLAQLPSRTYIRYEPRGVVLIIGPWNYPFQLLMVPLVGAVAAGNVVVLKPSEFAPATAREVQEIVQASFPPEYVSVVLGDAQVAAKLLEEDWDYIFFTGSTRVGRLVAESAARRLIPYTLELGGKCPAIVARDANISVAARRIAWGKWVNAGQTCIAPDYVLVQRAQYEALLESLKAAILNFSPDLSSPPADYAHIIHKAHYNRIMELLQEGKVVFGGHTNPERLYISPTLIVSPQGRLLEEEIFGPLLPIISYDTDEEAVKFIRKFSPPLALYIFTENKESVEFFLQQIPSGGTCINDTLMHIGSSRLPFGGIRQSGIGRYHGPYSFETFSHARTVLESPTWVDIPLRYPPYRNKLRWVRKLLG
ncbi:MAG: aldehyde dehydrogenase [Bacteroidia bacterium]|nr:aldehyde dehydrogenase [Bacteroidia bacterium]MDW8133997.1 aldehyde dehydrogenase [Bacteroidia bacterium]